jgi:hypothetical protein
MTSTTSAAPVSLLDVLRLREKQARGHGATYLAPVASEDSMLYWLSRACTTARKTAKRRQVHVAASADVDQSTIARFERGVSWPRDPDKVVSAYAEDLDVEPVDLWQEAMRLWSESRSEAADEPPAPLTRR